jgi:hypothetical protein
LIPLLNQRKLNQLRRGFNKTVEAALTPPTTKKKSTEVTYYQLAASIVADRVSELRSLADSLYDPHRTKRLHRMRIAAKRLRYAVELFAPCLGDRSLAFARQIAQQQSALGCLHDCDVWIEYFGAWLSKENKGKGGHTESQRDAMVWLLGHFTKLRAKHFRAALSQWREWERKDFLNKLLNTRSGDAKIEARSQLVKAEGPNRLEHQAQTESPTRRPTRKRRNIPAATQLSVGTNDSDQNGSSAARSRRRRKEITPVKREMTLPELNSEEAVVNEQSRQNQTNATEEMPEVTHRVVKLEELTSEAATDEAAS